MTKGTDYSSTSEGKEILPATQHCWAMAEVADGLEPLRRSLDARIAEGAACIALLEESQATSARHTDAAEELLSAFTARLTALEERIRPIRDETLRLTRARDSIDAVLARIAPVVAFYNAEADVRAALQRG